MKYLAFDGKVFDNELLCREYESGNEQERVNKLCNELKQWLASKEVGIGYTSISEGDDDDNVFLYSKKNEEIESDSLWDDWIF